MWTFFRREHCIIQTVHVVAICGSRQHQKQPSSNPVLGSVSQLSLAPILVWSFHLRIQYILRLLCPHNLKEVRHRLHSLNAGSLLAAGKTCLTHRLPILSKSTLTDRFRQNRKGAKRGGKATAMTPFAREAPGFAHTQFRYVEAFVKKMRH